MILTKEVGILLQASIRRNGEKANIKTNGKLVASIRRTNKNSGQKSATTIVTLIVTKGEEIERDPIGYLSRLQFRETQLAGIVAKLPKRGKKGSEIAERLKYESELEEHQQVIHKLKCALK